MPSVSQQPEEKALAEAINVAKKEASAAVAKEDFAAAMSAMAKLRPKVDAFFDKVTVNVDDKALARKPPQAAQRNPRSHPRGGGFFQDRGLDIRRGTRAGLSLPAAHAHDLKDTVMVIGIGHLQPIVALVAGIAS